MLGEHDERCTVVDRMQRGWGNVDPTLLTIRKEIQRPLLYYTRHGDQESRVFNAAIKLCWR